jgi:hypothetical protein
MPSTPNARHYLHMRIEFVRLKTSFDGDVPQSAHTGKCELNVIPVSEDVEPSFDHKTTKLFGIWNLYYFSCCEGI